MGEWMQLWAFAMICGVGIGTELAHGHTQVAALFALATAMFTVGTIL